MSEEAAQQSHSHEHRPLASYSALSSGFAAAFVGSLIVARRARGELPERYGIWDLITVGTATHKISRTISKERVTSFIRAPFVRYEEAAAFGEVSEQPRGAGARLAIGELLVCPYCLSHWVAAAFGAGMVGAPRVARLIAFIFTAETISDFLQLAYKHTVDEVAS